MLDLTVLARGGRWVLEDDDHGELGAFDSRAEALQAASEHEARVVEEPRHVLIQDGVGDWEEAVVAAPSLN